MLLSLTSNSYFPSVTVMTNVINLGRKMIIWGLSAGLAYEWSNAQIWDRSFVLSLVADG